MGSRTSFEITLEEAASEIEQVVVTALGIKRSEKAVAYNVQQIKAEDITTVKDANFINSLTGKVAGVTINASSSGVGGASKVVLRGNKSISQSSNALYVIDGIPMYNFGGGGGTEFDSRGATESIADLNPEDIESMSVLTGAAAAALYGSEAANGAVMITTKKGQAGTLKATFSSNIEFLAPFIQPEFQNRYGTGLNGQRSARAFTVGARNYALKPVTVILRTIISRRDTFIRMLLRFLAVRTRTRPIFRLLRSIRTALSPITNTTVTTSRSAILRTF